MNILRRRRQRKIDFDFSTLEDLWLLRAADYCIVYSCRNLSGTAKTAARSGEQLLRAADYRRRREKEKKEGGPRLKYKQPLSEVREKNELLCVLLFLSVFASFS